MNKNTAVLILSCDKYSDIWSVFFNFFFKYWNDCPFPVYLATNSTPFKHERVNVLFSNKKTTWSDELSVILDQIKEEQIIIILEDYLIYEKVNNDTIYECIHVFSKMDAAFMKLACFPKKYDSLWPFKKLLDHPNYGIIEKGSKYRVSLQTALWNKRILKSLLRLHESPWVFEAEASKRSNEITNPFLCVISNSSKKQVHGPITYYCTALTAGKWMRGAVTLCNNNKIEINLTSRPVESKSEEIMRYIYISSPLFIRKVFNYIGSKFSFK